MDTSPEVMGGVIRGHEGDVSHWGGTSLPQRGFTRHMHHVFGVKSYRAPPSWGHASILGGHVSIVRNPHILDTAIIVRKTYTAPDKKMRSSACVLTPGTSQKGLCDLNF